MSARILAALERAEPMPGVSRASLQPGSPGPLAPEAFHGIAGEVVQLIEPQTEADPAAILVQFLAAIGNLIGHGPHYRVEASEHHPKLNVLIVGDTSKSRKGTSWDRCVEPLRTVDPVWAGERIVRGLSSGEGLIHAVRDPIHRNERDRKSGDAETILIDPGVDDKRLLVQESEFASVLRVVGRQGNTLSPVIRDAWDQGALSTLTRNTPLRATRSHISIIGHITAEELVRELTATDVANGLMNRFLFVFARRSKMLPFGGTPIDWSGIVERLRTVRAKVATVQEVRMSEAARRDWIEAYPILSAGLPGLLGAATGRAEAQVIRLALVWIGVEEGPCLRGDRRPIGTPLA